MPESSTSSPAEGDGNWKERGDWATFDAKEFARQTIDSIEYGDAMDDVLEQRVMRIEECVAARWPRRWLLWARLRREIRASVATWDDAYIPRGDFLARRMETVGQMAAEQFRKRYRPGEQRGRHAAEDPGEGFLP